VTAILDTSVIVRYFTNDPPGTGRLAAHLLDGSETLLLPEVVIAETAHVLWSLYRVARQDIVDQLVNLVRKQNVAPLTLDKDITVEALLLCRPSRRVSFPDALTWAAARQTGTITLYTLDQRFPSAGLDLRGLV